MSELMKRILADKLKTRKSLAALPIEQKLTLMERMRDRSLLLASNPLKTRRFVTMPVVVVSGDGQLLGFDAQTRMLMSPVFRQFPVQSDTLQNAETLFEGIETRPEDSRVNRWKQSEPEFEPLLEA